MPSYERDCVRWVGPYRRPTTYSKCLRWLNIGDVYRMCPCVHRLVTMGGIGGCGRSDRQAARGPPPSPSLTEKID